MVLFGDRYSVRYSPVATDRPRDFVLRNVLNTGLDLGRVFVSLRHNTAKPTVCKSNMSNQTLSQINLICQIKWTLLDLILLQI